MFKIRRLLKAINEKLDRLALSMERDRLLEYMEYKNNPKRLYRVSFFAGILRGLGMAIGFSVLGAILIIMLRNIAQNNIPVIGKFISDIMEIVNSNKH